VVALAIDPSHAATLYAVTPDSGVFKSTNGGGSWTAVNSGLTSQIFNALAIDPSAPATLYAGTTSGVFKSVDGGGSWAAMNAGLTRSNVYVLAIEPSAPTTIYAGTLGGGVFDYEIVLAGQRPPVLPPNRKGIPRLVDPRR
jgi:photosystem II stability/assembly factor-like uncharacterized protein